MKKIALFVLLFSIASLNMVVSAQEVCNIQISEPVYDASRPNEARLPIVVTIQSDVVANDANTRPGYFYIDSNRVEYTRSGDLFNGANDLDYNHFYPIEPNGKTRYVIEVIVHFLDESQVTCNETVSLKAQR